MPNIWRMPVSHTSKLDSSLSSTSTEDQLRKWHYTQAIASFLRNPPLSMPAQAADVHASTDVTCSLDPGQPKRSSICARAQQLGPVLIIGQERFRDDASLEHILAPILPGAPANPHHSGQVFRLTQAVQFSSVQFARNEAFKLGLSGGLTPADRQKRERQKRTATDRRRPRESTG